ncbi:MAG: hypothetical protein WC310_01420 [Patescibacteria group bacterium]|jgi:hypothetical protein
MDKIIKHLGELQNLVMAQAAAKGFGIRSEDIIVAEKVALIHSELSESYEAYKQNNLDGHDGFYEELGDVLQRVLHLAGTFAVTPKLSERSFERGQSTVETAVLFLHCQMSTVYEHFRRGRLAEFKAALAELPMVIYHVSDQFDFSIIKAVQDKLIINQDRDWQKEGKVNEKFVGNN